MSTKSHKHKDHIAVLGAGMIGKTITVDLARNFHVTVFDKDKDKLSPLEGIDNVETSKVDLSKTGDFIEFLKDIDLVVGAVPGFMGFETLRAVIESGKDMVDISFFPEDPFLLDELATSKHLTAVVDCGVAPGLDNIILGYHGSNMDVEFFECLVGGLPRYPEEPFNYKAPFSPSDVIEEYTRPARIRENGQEITVPPLSGLEQIEFEEVGTLEAFYSDGLRTLLKTMPVPDMVEKTLRYPGHADYMRMLSKGGFFNQETVNLGQHRGSPLEFTSLLLFNQWKLEEGEEEFTIMRVRIKGRQQGESKEYTYHLLERTQSGTTSMARITGFTCTAVVNLVLSGKFSRKGVCPPEYVGEAPGCFEEVVAYLKERGVRVTY